VPLEATNPVAIGIDAAVVANHHVVVRRPGVSSAGETLEDFVVAPTLAGMETLTKRLSQWPGVMAVAEPTSMTWLPLSVALRNAGGDLALVGNRHSARLRSALAGKNKSDPIDAVVLSRAGELFALQPARIPAAGELALRRAAQRRGKALVEANRCLRRIISQARWAFPDVWNAFARSQPTALAVLNRWPHLENLGRARTSSITEVVAQHTRCVARVEARAARIRIAARNWAEFWSGHFDLDALAWETTELLEDWPEPQKLIHLHESLALIRRRWRWGSAIQRSSGMTRVGGCSLANASRCSRSSSALRPQRFITGNTRHSSTPAERLESRATNPTSSPGRAGGSSNSRQSSRR
jgi:hypothetical protein